MSFVSQAAHAKLGSFLCSPLRPGLLAGEVDLANAGKRKLGIYSGSVVCGITCWAATCVPCLHIQSLLQLKDLHSVAAGGSQSCSKLQTYGTLPNPLARLLCGWGSCNMEE